MRSAAALVPMILMGVLAPSFAQTPFHFAQDDASGPVGGIPASGNSNRLSPASSPACGNETEKALDDGGFETAYAVDDPAGLNDYMLTRFPSTALPTPPYVIRGAEVHANFSLATFPFAEVGIILGNPLPDCPDPGQAVLRFADPPNPSAASHDSLYLCSQSGYYVSSPTDVWVYVQFPPGAGAIEQPYLWADESGSSSSNTYVINSFTCFEYVAGLWGLRLLVDESPAPGFVALWADSLMTVPAPWDRVDFMDGRLARGVDTGEEPGITGGSATHTHMANPPNTSSGDNFGLLATRNALSGLATSADPHTHDVDIPAFATEAVTNLPQNRKLAFIMTDSLAVLPPGLIAMWAGPVGGLPFGWALCDGSGGNPDMVNYFARGSSPGEDPGTAWTSLLDHSHLVNPPPVNTTGPANSVNERGISSAGNDQAGTSHQHELDIPLFDSSTVDVNPPYMNLAFIRAQTETPVVPFLILMWAGSIADIPEGWALCDGTDGTPDLRNRFVRGSLTPGTTGGSETHVHAVDPPSTNTGFALTGVPTGPGASGIPHVEHQHNVNILAFLSAPAAHIPLFYKVAFIMRRPTGSAGAGEDFLPLRPVLRPATPNPMSSLTTLRFDLDRTAEVELSIHDVSGRRVRALVSGRVSAGVHQVEWNGRNDAGEPVAAGMYVVRLTAGSVQVSRKLILIR